jgi:predicted O-methyltransferase YrrM
LDNSNRTANPGELVSDERIRHLAEELAKGPAFDRGCFTLWQEHGFHITPNHYYQPIPDTSKLNANLWSRPSELPGVDMNVGAQIALLETVSERYCTEYDRFPAQATEVPFEFHFDQMMFRMVDAEILYCFVRHYRPSRIIEIGSGFSTLVAASACRKNLDEGHKTHLTCIEPHPTQLLRAGVPGLDRLIERPLEEVLENERSIFSKLGENDILFIDSSHVLRIGNDVHCEYLDLLPRVNPGVLIHVHDIFLPLEYPRQWVMEEFRFWTEQYLLQAFLTFNSAFSVIWAGCYMHLMHGDKLRKAFRTYDPATVLPGSFWMQRKIS